MDSFFGKSGTMQDLMDFAGSYQRMQSTNSMDRLGALGKLVSMIVGLLA